MKKYNEGFSLIELLVVIAIIGIISAVVLSAVSQSQARGYNTKIMQQLTEFRTAAQIYFTNHTGYGPGTSECGGTPNTTLFNTIDRQDGSPGLTIAADTLPEFSNVFCGSTDRQYAVKATLYEENTYWCVDNTGTSKKVTGTAASGTFCP